eukprot:CAMPEP_0119291786 /NCGR_PEP_ID=MMETSP1329-20130426/43006_1 /TAXON_ID=114041 /ORGANISM="Genus nov. species nov., Strain RCC1024" /LENGTH=235 /DNA_ID=CAMNT_0007292611 /DNA_START=123 /DNA_END=827 /DNA_ORIENTATION=+
MEFRRSAHVAAAMGADVVINYPLWIVAKRMGAGLAPVPPLRRLYSGGGALWISMAPTTVIEDGATTALHRTFGENELLCAAASGVVAAVLVTSQVEHCITAAHARGTSVLPAAAAIGRERGVLGLLLPPGMTAMAGREIPFAAALFAIRPRIAAAAEKRLPAPTTLGGRFVRELCCGGLAAVVAVPPSHPPSVVAAYQQASGLSLAKAMRDIYAAGGYREFFRGLPARTVSLAGT